MILSRTSQERNNRNILSLASLPPKRTGGRATSATPSVERSERAVSERRHAPPRSVENRPVQSGIVNMRQFATAKPDRSIAKKAK